MAKTYTKRVDGLDVEGFAWKLLALPNDVFIRMMMKSGLPPMDSRELCQAHKRLSQ